MGIAGAFLYILSYFLLQTGFIRGNSVTYTLMNLMGASFAAVSLLSSFNHGAMINSACWILISLYGLGRIYYINRTPPLNDDEKAFIAEKLVDLSDIQAHYLFKGSLWIDGAEGDVITVQGERNESLVYLLSGAADVIVGDKVVSQILPHSYIGELTCLSGEEASATVRLTGPSRYLALSAENLRHLAAKDINLRQILELSFAGELKRKLLAANEMLTAQQ